MDNINMDRMVELEQELALYKCREKLLRSFPLSFINDNDEFIAERKTNQYFILKYCDCPLDVQCKVLEWLSRPAAKGIPYNQEWRNQKYRTFFLEGINQFLDTNFSQDDIAVIYQALGNSVNHSLTIQFVENNFDMSILQA